MNYKDALTTAIAGWNTDPIEDEWLFERFRDEFVETMSPSEAFDSFGDTVVLLMQEADESTATEILQTLIALARRSQTTEVPSVLAENMDAIAAQFRDYGDYARSKLAELRLYYRIA